MNNLIWLETEDGKRDFAIPNRLAQLTFFFTGKEA